MKNDTTQKEEGRAVEKRVRGKGGVLWIGQNHSKPLKQTGSTIWIEPSPESIAEEHTKVSSASGS